MTHDERDAADGELAAAIAASVQSYVRDFPMTMPSLRVNILRVHVPMSEEDYTFLMDTLSGMKKALVKGEAQP